MQYDDCVKQYKNDRQKEMVDGACRLFLKQGIEPVKMTDIAKECGIGVASLYRYFGTKTSIVIEVGVSVWNDIKELFDGVYECDSFLEKTGIEQLKDLMRFVPVLYESHQELLRFIASFDTFVLTNNVGKEELKDYEQSIMNFYPLFSKSWETGVFDHTVRSDRDPKRLYFSTLHALLAMSQKFLHGEILSGDNFSYAKQEMDLIIDMAVAYVRNQQGEL